MAEDRQVLVTGGTGYIAKHIVARLLASGFAVRATARTEARFDEIRDAVAGHVPPEALGRLNFAALDLSADQGWDTAMDGIDIVMHTASPFPLIQPKDEAEVIRPAVDGALRALRAAHAGGIRRFVMTSSTAAIMGNRVPDGKAVFDESCWLDPDEPDATPYARSKTLAERAVWDWARDNAPDMQVTMVNPGFVLGAPLDPAFGTSIRVIERLMKGADPMVPDFGFSCIAVEDVADLHVAVIDKPETHGQRIVAVERFLWFLDMAKALRSSFPNRKIPTRRAPDFVVKVLSLFDPSIRTILPLLGKTVDFDNARARAVLGRPLKDTRASVVETGQYLDTNRLV